MHVKVADCFEIKILHHSSVITSLFENTNDEEGYITEIKPRKSELIRPPIANVTQAVVVHSANHPTFSALLLDRFLVILELKNIKPFIVDHEKRFSNEKANEKNRTI